MKTLISLIVLLIAMAVTASGQGFIVTLDSNDPNLFVSIGTGGSEDRQSPTGVMYQCWSMPSGNPTLEINGVVVATGTYSGLVATLSKAVSGSGITSGTVKFPYVYNVGSTLCGTRRYVTKVAFVEFELCTATFKLARPVSIAECSQIPPGGGGAYYCDYPVTAYCANTSRPDFNVSLVFDPFYPPPQPFGWTTPLTQICYRFTFDKWPDGTRRWHHPYGPIAQFVGQDDMVVVENFISPPQCTYTP